METTRAKQGVQIVAILVGWCLTLGGFIWTTATTNAGYNYKIERIEKELIVLDERLDLAETFRMEIRTDLAQIKTDLIWIRKDLERGD